MKLIAFVLVLCIAGIHGHGRLMDPAGRSSRWRVDPSAPANYDDNQLWCGGLGPQWNTYGGKCGLCGDSYGDGTPRANELGGKYGQGVIVKSYNSRNAKVGVQITANHLGHIFFEVCNLDQWGRESEECFTSNRLRMADGSDKMNIGTTIGWIDANVVFPQGLNCRHCVLRWTYITANNWGMCGNGSGAIGCGPQETFKACADVSISAFRLEIPKEEVYEPEAAPEIPDEIPEDV